MRPVLARATLVALLCAPAAIWAAEPPAGSRPNGVLDLAGEPTVLMTAADVRFNAYIVGPQRAPRGILVIPTGISHDASARRVADQFAGLGYRAVVVDIAGGGRIENPAKARAYRQAFDQNDANAKYRAGLEALRDPGRKLAVMGWCFGGGQALEASLAAADLVSATVLYAAAPQVEAQRLVHLKSPVLAIHAEGEGAPSGDRMKAFEAAMRQAGAALEVQKVNEKAVCAGPNDAPFPPSARDFLNRYLK